MRSMSQRKAFTLVELLVVIAIIGILIGMLLPAVQQVREAARRSQCMNNIRQLALSTHNFESTHEHFPPGTNYWAQNDTTRYVPSPPWNNRNGTPYRGNYHGWGTFILPYIEQNALYDQLGITVAWGEDMFDSSGTQHLTGYELPPFMCPSDPVDGGLNNTYFTDGGTTPTPLKNGKSNYVACTGYNTWAGRQTRSSWSRFWGIMRINSKTTFAGIRDGSSNTILLGERSSEDETGPAPQDMQGAIWVGRMHPANTARSEADGGNYAWGGRTGGFRFLPNGDYRARSIVSSGHPQGGIIAMADGSGHFISDIISNTVFRNMSMMADGNTIPGF